MELKEFIKAAITDITEAVSELQEELKNGTVINPTLARAGSDKTLLVENEVRIIERLDFDIAVTASEDSGISGNAKAGIRVFGAKMGAETKEKTENVSRLTFSIPVILPSTHVKTVAETAKERIRERSAAPPRPCQ